MSDVIVAPETRELPELARALTGWLAGKLPNAGQIELTGFDYPRGAGQSHETILFNAHWLEDGLPCDKGLVVRIKPRSFTVFPDNLFDEQYQVMKVLHDGDYVPVAKPLWLEHDPAILGAPFFVMEKVVGRVPVSIPPYARTGWLAEATPQQRRRLWKNAVEQLAAVQRVPLSALPFLQGPEHAASGLAQEWDKYQRFVRWVQEDDETRRQFGPVLERVIVRLTDAWPKNSPEGMVWGDARIGNMMFDDDVAVVAVMDWEQPSLGGALHDLAWFCVISEAMHGRNGPLGHHLDGMGTREETIARWEDLTGKSAADLEWYEEFTQLKMSLAGIRLGQLRGTTMADAQTLARRMRVG